MLSKSNSILGTANNGVNVFERTCTLNIYFNIFLLLVTVSGASPSIYISEFWLRSLQAGSIARLLKLPIKFVSELK